MKTKILLSILAFGLIVNAFGQKPTMELTFTAENNEQYIPLDSIFIENLTQGGDTTLYAPDTVLVLDYITSIENNGIINGNSLLVSQNYPNPFIAKTEVNVYLPKDEHIIIVVQDVLGRKLVQYKNTLSQGNHSFTFYAGNEKYYLLTVIGKQTSKTIKMLNANNIFSHGGKCKLVYNQSNNNIVGFKSQTVRNNFTFNLGDELSYTAFTDVEVLSIINSPSNSETITFQFEVWTPCPGMSTVTDIDGNIYNTVQIFDQCWMKENLRTTTYSNNTPVPNVTDNNEWFALTSGAYIWYDNDIMWKELYGGLYNWYTAVDTNGICPTGWHVPTHDDWSLLIDNMGGWDPPHGNQIKSCRQVYSPLGGNCETYNHPRWHQNNSHHGTDKYHLSGLPGGLRYGGGLFDQIGKYCLWWSSTEQTTTLAWNIALLYNEGMTSLYYNGKKIGFSIRCIKD